MLDKDQNPFQLQNAKLGLYIVFDGLKHDLEGLFNLTENVKILVLLVLYGGGRGGREQPLKYCKKRKK